jgi:hypothetical protein
MREDGGHFWGGGGGRRADGPLDDTKPALAGGSAVTIDRDNLQSCLHYTIRYLLEGGEDLGVDSGDVT